MPPAGEDRYGVGMADPPRSPSPRALVQRLESLRSAGVLQLPACESRAPEPEPANHAVAPEPPPLTRRNPEPAGEAGVATPTASPRVATDLTVLSQQVAGCTACPELASTRTQTVFGVGNPDARLCFLGEAPGADEDQRGEPFVGPSGQLLDKMLAACNLSRGDIYLLNVLKCRPPGNRNPTPAEAGACRGFLERQLELIDPEFICCLGAVAAQNFLQTTTPIGRLRGKVHDHAGRKVVCTYHPAYLLRNPSAKRPAWDDLQMLMRELRIDL